MTIRPHFPGEHIDAMLKRLKKATQNSGMMTDLRRSSTFLSKSERRKFKAAVSRKRQSRERYRSE